VETPEVQDKPKARADGGGPECRDVALYESHLDSALPCPLARDAQSSRHELDAGDLPSPPRASATDCMPVPQPRSSARP
jgi:hypothetical protein